MINRSGIFEWKRLNERALEFLDMSLLWDLFIFLHWKCLILLPLMT